MDALVEEYEALSLVYWPLLDQFRLELGRRLTAEVWGWVGYMHGGRVYAPHPHPHH